LIAVTGIGVVSAYGMGLEDFGRGIYEGQGIHGEAPTDLARFGLRAAGFVPQFSTRRHIAAMRARRMSRFSQLAVVSSKDALEMSGLRLDERSRQRVGVVVGTGIGSVSSTDTFFEGLLRGGPQETNPMVFPETVQNIAAAHISIELGLKGPNTTISQGDCAGEYALYYACGLLRDGRADAVIVCGLDELTEPLLTGMKALGLLSRRGRLCPFDLSRDGMVPGEGAAAVVLERTDDARRRGGSISARIRGFGLISDSVDRFSYSRPEAMVAAMQHAVRAAGIVPGFVCASANSTVELDRAEARALREFLSDGFPVTALKSQVGSFMASGVLKVAAAAVALRERAIPPIFGLERPEIEGVDYVIGTPRTCEAGSCLINGFSHGGANVSIVVSAEGDTV